VSNPCTLTLNDLTVTIFNTDIVKDMCPNLLVKNMVPAKIDLSLRGILEQRLLYPIYPPNPETPIEYEQIDQLAIKEMPDVLITSSDLMQFAKNIEGCLCINPGSIIKQENAGTYCSLNILPFDYKATVRSFKIHCNI
jgi:DNA polymerase alpha subunit B